MRNRSKTNFLALASNIISVVFFYKCPELGDDDLITGQLTC